MHNVLSKAVHKMDKYTGKKGSKDEGRTETKRKHSEHRRERQQVRMERRWEGGKKKRRAQMKQEEPAQSFTKVCPRLCALFWAKVSGHVLASVTDQHSTTSHISTKPVQTLNWHKQHGHNLQSNKHLKTVVLMKHANTTHLKS